MDHGKVQHIRKNESACNKNPVETETSNPFSFTPVKNSVISAKQQNAEDFTSVTPQKRDETSLEANIVKLLQKYETIIKFFDSMTTSLRLLSLRKKLSTFQSISSQVEVLAKRKFCYNDLAQIKYILPEVIQIEKVLVHDTKTLCMKPDMKITLQFDAIEDHCESSDFIAIRQLFIDRLQTFSLTHPEDSDIPHAKLPEPFSQTSQLTDSDDKITHRSGSMLPEQSFLESSVEPELTLAQASLLSPHFTRCFSNKADASETKTWKTQPVSSPCSSFSSLDNSCTEVTRSEEPEECLDTCSRGLVNKPPTQSVVSESCSRELISNSPPQSVDSESRVISSACESPMLKPAPSSNKIEVETPAQLIQRRLMPKSSDDKPKNDGSQSRSSYKQAKRSLDFFEGDGSSLNSILLDAIPETREQKDSIKEGNDADSTLPSKKGELNYRSAVKDQSGLEAERKTAAGLHNLVTLVHHIFQSANNFPITKQELVHKIIFDNLDIVEKREVEEQIEILEKLVPDWISKKLAPSGDILYNIKKVADLNSVKASVRLGVNSASS